MVNFAAVISCFCPSSLFVAATQFALPLCLPACVSACPHHVLIFFSPPCKTKDRLHGLLTAVSEELPDVPLYYTLPSLCETVHCSSPKMDDFRSALVNAGYRVSAFHKEADAIKTDAPNNVVWDIIRCW